MTQENGKGATDGDGFFDSAAQGDKLPDDIPVTGPDHPAAARDGDPLDAGPREGTSAEERAADSEPVEEGDGQFALGILSGDEALKGIKDLIKRGAPIQYEVSLMSAGVPARNLVDPETTTQLLVDVVPVTYKLVPDREKPVTAGRPGKVKGWKVVVQMRPAFVQDAHTEAAAAALREHAEATV